MAFFDMLNDFAKNISDKTGEAIETGKLNSKITSEKNAAGEDLKKIGEFYYNRFLEGQADEAIIEYCESAKNHFDAAAEAQAEIDRIKAANEAVKIQAATPVAQEGVVCASCGRQNSPGTKFCSDCGAKLESPAPIGTCPSCGTVNTPGTKFCSNCGTKLELPPPAALCPSCGEEFPEGVKFCTNCGYKREV